MQPLHERAWIAVLAVLPALAAATRDQSLSVPITFDVHLLPKRAPSRLSNGGCDRVNYTLQVSNNDGMVFESELMLAQHCGAPDALSRYESQLQVNLPWPHVHLAKYQRYFARIQTLDDQLKGDYIVDITRVLNATESDLPVVRHAKLRSSQLTLSLTVTRSFHQQISVEPVSSPFMCGCVSDTCSCCEHFDIPDLSINETGCANISYIPKDYGIRVQMQINNVVFFDDEISARNPPPLCAHIPYVEDTASVCLWFHNITATDETLFACVEAQFQVSHVHVIKYDLGCFHIGPLRHGVEQELGFDTQVEDETQPPTVETKQIDIDWWLW